MTCFCHLYLKCTLEATEIGFTEKIFLTKLWPVKVRTDTRESTVLTVGLIQMHDSIQIKIKESLVNL